jgi:predicted nucleotidyltransferase
MLFLERYQQQISGICQKYRVKNLSVFGSALTEHFNENSDIDFLIELDGAADGIKRYMNVKFELEELFLRSVDLVMPKAIKNSRIKEYFFQI